MIKLKLTKEELLNKVDTLPIDDETKIVLLEDISDSFNLELVTDEYKDKYEELLIKYKERFMSATDEVVEDKEDEDIEEIIDVKEI